MTALPRIHKPQVTDHAVVRWLERVVGFDIEAIRRQILDDDRRGWAAAGAIAIAIPSMGVQLLLDEGRVTTVVPAGGAADWPLPPLAARLEAARQVIAEQRAVLVECHSNLDADLQPVPGTLDPEAAEILRDEIDPALRAISDAVALLQGAPPTPVQTRRKKASKHP